MKDSILWFARMALVSAGSTLVAKGYIEAGDAEQVAGAFVAILGAAWSYLERRKLKK